MNSDSLAEFRYRVSRRARQIPAQWEASRKLLEGPAFSTTLVRLREAAQNQDLPRAVKAVLLHLFEQDAPQCVQDLDGAGLKSITGLPGAKALRALAVFFELVPGAVGKWSVTELSSGATEDVVRTLRNPFDLLRHTEQPSVLEIGAGDLSFAEELTEQYFADPKPQHRPLVFHGLDRLDPRSELGGPLHADRERLRKLQRREGLSFAFFGNQNMFELGKLDAQQLLAPRYTIATCWAPATPTFAYEPTRLSERLIHQDLERTKGSYCQTRFGKERALEVQHAGRALLFPPWKFEIAGPLALLNLLASRGCLCVLGSVDAQVFWELLAQLLDEPRYRPQNELFDAVTLPKVFGELYDVLISLPIGNSVDLADLAPLRREYPASPSSMSMGAPQHPFRYVRLSRGATFPAVPASSTARKFSAMTEEVPPWLVTLVPA